MKNKCEALEGCERKVRYSFTDYKLNKTVYLCIDHFKQGMKDYFEEDPIIKVLKHEGLI